MLNWRSNWNFKMDVYTHSQILIIKNINCNYSLAVVYFFCSIINFENACKLNESCRLVVVIESPTRKKNSDPLWLDSCKAITRGSLTKVSWLTYKKNSKHLLPFMIFPTFFFLASSKLFKKKDFFFVIKMPKAESFLPSHFKFQLASQVLTYHSKPGNIEKVHFSTWEKEDWTRHLSFMFPVIDKDEC